MQTRESETNPMSSTDFEMLGMDHVAYVKECPTARLPSSPSMRQMVLKLH